MSRVKNKQSATNTMMYNQTSSLFIKTCRVKVALKGQYLLKNAGVTMLPYSSDTAY